MGSKYVRQHIRTLVVFVLLLSSLYAALGATTKWGNGQWTPKLALDLAGGTEIVLQPRVEAGRTVTSDAIKEAIAVMRQRVDASGVSEAQISSQGGQNIVVELPGDPEDQRKTRELVRQSAQMRFRPVLTYAAGAPIPQDPAAGQPGAPGAPAPGQPGAPAPGAPAPGAPAPGAPAPGAPAPTPGAPTSGASSAPAATSPAPAVTQTSNGAPMPKVATLAQAKQPVKTVTGTAKPNPTPAPGASTEPADPNAPVTAPPGEGAPPAPPGEKTNSDMSWITPEIQKVFTELDCTKPESRSGGMKDDLDKPLVTCSRDGQIKYILGPVDLEGKAITDSYGGPETNAQGQNTGGWAVYMNFNKEGGDKFREVTGRLSKLQAPNNQFAIVLDGLVLSAPKVDNAIPDGRATITGQFTQTEVMDLARQLKFGALPMTFDVQTENQIQATLGAEQLQKGIIAGLFGLALVIVFAMFQYRALGLVVVASLVAAALWNWAAISLLGVTHGYRLSLPGVTGCIIAIGITADSFIVYFERIRDELREGRPLVSAVEIGWRRAQRTILISGLINVMAAVVLFFLAVGAVKGFAFTLGLTSIIDLVIVMFFTHPVIGLLARKDFFASGHKLSGLSEASLTHAPAYAGAGRFRGTEERTQLSPMTLAERRAARAAEEAEAANAQSADSSSVEDKTKTASTAEDK